MHCRIFFPGAVVTAQITRKKGHVQGEKTCLLVLVEQKTKKKEHKKTKIVIKEGVHLSKASHVRRTEDLTLSKISGASTTTDRHLSELIEY